MLLQRQADALADHSPARPVAGSCGLTYEDIAVHVKGGVALPYPRGPSATVPTAGGTFPPPPRAPLRARRPRLLPGRPRTDRYRRRPGSTRLPMPPLPWG